MPKLYLIHVIMTVLEIFIQTCAKILLICQNPLDFRWNRTDGRFTKSCIVARSSSASQLGGLNWTEQNSPKKYYFACCNPSSTEKGKCYLINCSFPVWTEAAHSHTNLKTRENIASSCGKPSFWNKQTNMAAGICSSIDLIKINLLMLFDGTFFQSHQTMILNFIHVAFFSMQLRA